MASDDDLREVTDDALGVLILAAFGLDREWMKSGACYGWGSQRPDPGPTPWQVSPSQTVNGVSGTELMRYARLICFTCVAQYDCLAFAIEGKMIAGTWAVSAKALHWLQGQDDALDLVEMARKNAVPVQTIAASIMAERLGGA